MWHVLIVCLWYKDTDVSIPKSRVPEGTSIHDKAYYTTNKDHLYRALSDISLHVQAATQADLAHAKRMC